MDDNCLEIKNLSKSFTSFQLRNISLKLARGSIMGLVGPNGAGKTTIIKLILNMLGKDTGEILIFGKDNIDNEGIIKQSIGIVLDSVFYVDTWSIKTVEKAVSMFYEGWRHDVFADMLKQLDLPEGKKVKDLSRGMQMKLMIACAFSHDAKLLILDEPTSGLDPVVRSEFLELLQEYVKDGERSVLFSTHITTDLEKTADCITLINQGELFFSGSMENLLSSYRLVKWKQGDVTKEFEKAVYGLRKTVTGFEGLLAVNNEAQYENCVLDDASIDDIVVSINKGVLKQ